MTEDNTEIEVNIRERWIVQTIGTDENGIGEFIENLEFHSKSEAILRAEQQADKYGVSITHGWNS